VVRGIQPSMVFISVDAKEINFTDITSMTSENSDVVHKVKSSFPYSALHELDKDDDYASDRFLDMWSIGVIILEIICGSDIVLATGCFKHVRLLLDECTEHIDSSTHYLLDQLLNNGNDEVISNYVNDTLGENP
jgi:hypothetical protein